MTLSLAQFIGPLLVVLGISFISKRKMYQEWFKHLERTQPLFILWGAVEFVAGLAIVLNHNLWTTFPEVIVSLIGWGAVVEGTVVLITRKDSLKQLIASVTSPAFWMVVPVVLIALGGYLSWVAYLA